jgi:predicted flap endonuclease-1-like 5' DNA nuclease
MTDLLWQTTLVLAVAFFFGAVLACGLKRRFYYGKDQKGAAAAPVSIATTTARVPAASEPKIEVAPRPAAEGERFERAISGQSTPVSKISVSSGTGAPTKPEAGGAGPSEDLTRIRGIDPVIQKQLKDLGIRRFQEIARLTPADVKGINDKLGLKGRIEQENWIGQAQILATGGETYYSRRRDRGVPIPDAVEPAALAPTAAAPSAPVVAPQPKAAAPAAPAPAAAAAPAASAAEPRSPVDVSQLRSVRSEALVGDAPRGSRPWSEVDDLKRIRGIGVLIEKAQLAGRHALRAGRQLDRRRYRAHQPHLDFKVASSARTGSSRRDSGDRRTDGVLPAQRRLIGAARLTPPGPAKNYACA